MLLNILFQMHYGGEIIATENTWKHIDFYDGSTLDQVMAWFYNKICATK